MGDSSSASISLSTASGSFIPSPEKNLMPLSSNGLCEAEIMIPAERRSARVRNATAGVGIGPTSSVSTPAAERPDSSADSSMYPEMRVSLPISTAGRLRWGGATSARESTLPAQ
jgi:hypothetical protein